MTAKTVWTAANFFYHCTSPRSVLLVIHCPFLQDVVLHTAVVDAEESHRLVDSRPHQKLGQSGTVTISGVLFSALSNLLIAFNVVKSDTFQLSTYESTMTLSYNIK